MTSIYVTHCSRDKDPGLQLSGREVIPEQLYTSEGLQQFIRFCQVKGYPWAIFSDHYGVVFPEEKIKWYSKPPSTVNEAEFAVLLENFHDRLSVYSQVYFYHRADETHPLFTRVVAMARERGMNIEELSKK